MSRTAPDPPSDDRGPTSPLGAERSFGSPIDANETAARVERLIDELEAGRHGLSALQHQLSALRHRLHASGSVRTSPEKVLVALQRAADAFLEVLDVLDEALDRPEVEENPPAVVPASRNDGGQGEAAPGATGLRSSGRLAPERDPSGIQRARVALEGARVLLVEDNPLNQELACELLGRAGIEVVVVEHGQAAIDILRDGETFDGILMDGQMPVLDGYEATRRIRADLGLRDLPILAMTANATLDDLDRALASGMNDHITKPIEIASMFETLTRWITLGGVSRARPPGARNSSPPSTRNSDGGSSGPRSVPPPPVVELEVFDPEAPLRVTMGNAELVEQLFERFRESHATFEARFANACREGDFVAARRLVHTLRGDASMLGGPRVARAASVLEAVVERRGDADELGPALATTVDELALFVRAIAHDRAGASADRA
jgi:CheY-like chemotaxis protein/HPt (histidine-containing phosphotransfer) domain-containing protein